MVLQVEAELICALTISISRREQGVNERRTSLHTRCCLAFHYKTLPHLHHHQGNLTVVRCLFAFLFLLNMHERNDQRFHTYYISCQTQGNYVALGWLPRRQKHSSVGGAGVWFSGVDLFVKFTCSCWVPRSVFINWFAKVVASKLLAI